MSLVNLSKEELALVIFCLNVYWEQNEMKLDSKVEINRCEAIEKLSEHLQKEKSK